MIASPRVRSVAVNAAMCDAGARASVPPHGNDDSSVGLTSARAIAPPDAEEMVAAYFANTPVPNSSAPAVDVDRRRQTGRGHQAMRAPAILMTEPAGVKANAPSESAAIAVRPKMPAATKRRNVAPNAWTDRLHEQFENR
jgi:hypothetical protein